MKSILILGAGFVSRPGVRYLLDSGVVNVTVADIFPERAEELVEGYENGRALSLDINDSEKLEQAVKAHDIVVSLLPWTLHLKVADLCVKNSRDMATTSYVSEGMKALDPEVKDRGLLFLNEIGVDPGIDHMSAMKIIDEVEAEGGEIVEFYSTTGGLPAPEDNDNPFGYKFSWSPKGVILASRNAARFLEKGKVVDIPGEELFLNYKNEHIEGLGDFELYPNRDSVVYKDIYGLEGIETLIRGTYRYPGWCRTLKLIVDMGLLSDTPQAGISGIPFREALLKLPVMKGETDPRDAVMKKFGLDDYSEELKRLEWLGIFSDQPTPDQDNFLDVLSHQMKKKLCYRDDEKDMILMQHTFIVRNNDGSRDKITSTLIDYGIPGGDSSMSRTVSLPLAIGVKLMAEGKFNLTGVRIPVLKELYMPVLSELENLGIRMVEKRSAL